MNPTEADHQRPLRALLVSVYNGAAQKLICGEHLQELAFLCETYGIEVVEKFACQLRTYDASTFVSSGKLKEIIELANQNEVDIVVFDDEISPGQQRNLEETIKRKVMDRTEVILGVFAQRAQTKEARLQVELAKIKYEAPRLKRLWTHLSRQSGTGGSSGSGGYQKGEGEKQIEIDRRILKQKIDVLQKEINEVIQIRNTQRNARIRSGIPTFAIVGYTNAGKSTLINALTDANVFVEDKLFATLDTTTRKFTLSNNQEILLIDTVGFIRKLPHLLVAAFKSTLEEALQADILLHLVDSSHPMAQEQSETTYEVLKELGAEDKTIITLLNKVDKLEDPSTLLKLRVKNQRSVPISALERTGFEEMQEAMLDELAKRRASIFLKIPQSDYAAVSEVMRLGQIITQDYEENDVILHANVPQLLAEKFKKYIFEK